MASVSARAAEVLRPDNGRFGSGSVIAPGLVITARHVVADSSGTLPEGCQVLVRLLRHGGGRAVPVAVVWDGGRELDVVLLRGEPDLLGRQLEPLRWGELTCEAPTDRPECRAVGFPRAMKRGDLRDCREVIGQVSAISGLRAAKYELDVTNATAQEASGWSGLSGAGLFCHDLLIGIVNAVPDGWGARVLWATPARRLLASDGFVQAVTAAVGAAPWLESADQGLLFEHPPRPRLSPSYLLSPRAEVVPFSGMHYEIDQLLAWCVSGQPADVAVVTGPGGVGKTRLAAELMRRLAHRGTQSWTTGFLVDSRAHEPSSPYRMLTANTRPLLLAIDYAETRIGQVEQVLDALGNARHTERVRVLLLARSIRGWWTSLSVERQHTEVMGDGVTVHLSPTAAWHNLLPDQAIQDAADAFRSRIDVLRHGVPTAADDDPAVTAARPRKTIERQETTAHDIVSAHMTALAAVLADNDRQYPQAGRPVDVLIGHEHRYWSRSVRAAGLEATFKSRPELLRQLVASQRIVGATSRREALAAVAAAFEAHNRDIDEPQPLAPDTRTRIERMLADLYPSTGGVRWGAMSPDTLAAELIAQADEESDHELVAHLLPNDKLSPEQRRHGLTILARASATQHTLVASTARAFLRAPQTLLPDAISTAEALTQNDALVWLNGIRSMLTAQSQTRSLTTEIQQLDAAVERIQLTPEAPPPPELPAPAEANSSAETGPEEFHSIIGEPHNISTLRRFDQALRTLAHNAIRAGTPLPDLVTALITTAGDMELRLAASAAPIAPFQGTESALWQCPGRTTALLTATEAAGVPSPYPALVPFGHAPQGGSMLVNLEAMRLIYLQSPAGHSSSTIHNLARDLAHSPFADELHLHLVQVDLPARDQNITAKIHQHRSLHSALVQANQNHTSSRSRAPQIVLSKEPPSHRAGALLSQIVDAPISNTPFVITAAASPEIGPMVPWTLSITTQ
ncbi:MULTISPECIES: S1 family peptidase [Streptomyces violaceusniger group]|uniref:Trypsin-like peptidase domain-containing protein n=2 Tax=Streptomyces rhizosphaericus TaxID=114699 RepID=A0ABP4CQ80_9ACTN|nr:MULTISPECIES: serine protease [Streptomyces violaceusniger group]